MLSSVRVLSLESGSVRPLSCVCAHLPHEELSQRPGPEVPRCDTRRWMQSRGSPFQVYPRGGGFLESSCRPGRPPSIERADHADDAQGCRLRDRRPVRADGRWPATSSWTTSPNPATSSISTHAARTVSNRSTLKSAPLDDICRSLDAVVRRQSPRGQYDHCRCRRFARAGGAKLRPDSCSGGHRKRDMPRFDSLVHATRDGRWPNGRDDAGWDRLISELDRAHITRACLVGLAGLVDNEYVLERARSTGSRLVPIAGLNPTECSSLPALAARIADIARAGFAGIKLHPRLNDYDPLDERSLYAIGAAGEQGSSCFSIRCFASGEERLAARRTSSTAS